MLGPSKEFRIEPHTTHGFRQVRRLDYCVWLNRLNLPQRFTKKKNQIFLYPPLDGSVAVIRYWGKNKTRFREYWAATASGWIELDLQDKEKYLNSLCSQVTPEVRNVLLGWQAAEIQVSWEGHLCEIAEVDSPFVRLRSEKEDYLLTFLEFLEWN